MAVRQEGDAIRTVVPVVIRNHRVFVLLLGALSMMAPLSTDMYLPATPAIASALGASQAVVVATLSGFFLGFGSGQLFWGPLSDRFGRRLPMIAAILLYTGASIGCAHVHGGSEFVVWRFLEGFGGCGPPVIAQAMIRDVYERHEGARVMSMMQLVGAVAPTVAPSIGGQIMVWSEWRVIFWVLAIFGGLSMIGVFLVPDTLPRANRPRLSVRDLLAGYVTLITDRRYLGYALSGGMFGGAFFGYLSGSAFVFIQYYHVPPQWFGPLFSLGIVGMMAANVLNRRLVLRFDPSAVLRWALAAAALDGIAISVAGFAESHWGGVWLLAPLLLLFVACQGLVAGNAVVCALAAFPSRAGTAAGLSGVLRSGIGAASGVAIGVFANGTPGPMTVVIGVMAMLALAVNRWLVRARGFT